VPLLLGGGESSPAGCAVLTLAGLRLLGLRTGGVQHGDPSPDPYPYSASKARAECSGRTWGRKADWRPEV